MGVGSFLLFFPQIAFRPEGGLVSVVDWQLFPSELTMSYSLNQLSQKSVGELPSFPT